MRIHILPEKVSPAGAGLFLVSSLLISHGVRRDSEAWVRVGGKWLIVKGSTVRQLRPDAISSEAWVKAAVYKGKAERLGARIADLTLDEVLDPARTYCVSNKYRIVYDEYSRVWYGYFIYVSRPDLCPADIDRMLGAPGLLWMAPALVNSILDRLSVGLPP